MAEARLALGFPFILAWGLGGVFNMRKSTSSSRLSLAEAMERLFPTGDELPNEMLEPLCNAVGGLVLAWGAVECALHLLTVSAYDDAGGSGLEPIFPRELSRKIRFLRGCFSKIDALKPFSNNCRPLLEQTAKLGKKRHNVIHAVMTGYSKETDRISFVSLDADKTGHLIRKTMHSISEIQEMSLDCASLGSQLAEVAGRINDALKHEPDNDACSL